MTNKINSLTAFLVAAGALAASLAGCEIIASVDRSQIPGGGGAGGAGSNMASTTSETSATSSTSTSTSTSSTSSSGMCPGGAMACAVVGDCPNPASDCVDATCDNGCCGTTNKGSGQACTGGGGAVCDGNGNCVGCVAETDCPAQPTMCKTNTCTGNTCGTQSAPNTTTCNDNGGAVCDGNGTCVQCNAATDCQAQTTVCKTNTCTGNTCGTQSAAKGTVCNDSGGVVCDGNGSCVATHCNDTVMDADETDVDCGGSCGPCADNKKCAMPDDCTSKVCDAVAHTCTPASCVDQVQNGGESDVDCGGSCATKCADQKHCSTNGDCANNFCFGPAPGICVSCGDGKKDGNETDVDCGGAQCDAQNKLCGTNKGCGSGADCQSGLCQGGTCQLKPSGASCTDNAQCTSGACGVNGTGNCCAAACTGGTCGATGCAVSGACVYPGAGTACGTASCSNGQLTPAGSCSGTGMCTPGAAAACPGSLKCASATACLASCSADTDCQSPSDYCSGGACVPKGGAGTACSSNNECTSARCGTSGTGHCCTSSCPAGVPACGATDCDNVGACAYPGTNVAPPAFQSPGDCQKVVCNGAGGVTTADDATDTPVSNSACSINPQCIGPSPLTPSFDPAPTGTPCTSPNDPAAHVCGDTSNGSIARTCVECNTDADCLAVNDAGVLVCDTSMGICE